MDAAPWTCSVSDLVTATKGQLLSQSATEFSLVGTDTRRSLSGMLFIPLKGENFDAHDFVTKAIDQGAKVILVHKFLDEWKPLLAKAAFVQVADTLLALQAFARFWRRKN